jgi:hypothetical protein
MMQDRGMNQMMSGKTNYMSPEKLENDAIILDALRHYRHDWMNRMQMVLAYLQLNKMDELQHYLQTLLHAGEFEKMLFQTGCPKLGLWFLMNVYKFGSLDVQVVVNRSSDKQFLSLPGKEIVDYFDAQLQKLEQIATTAGKQKVVVRIQLDEQEYGYSTQLECAELNCLSDESVLQKVFSYTKE